MLHGEKSEGLATSIKSFIRLKTPYGHLCDNLENRLPSIGLLKNYFTYIINILNIIDIKFILACVPLCTVA